MSNPAFCVLHHNKWIVRMVIPTDVRGVIGQNVFRVSTGESDRQLAVEKSHHIIAGLKKRIRLARATLQTAEHSEAALLAARYRELKGADADCLVLEDVLAFALQQGGHSLTEYGRRLKAAGGAMEDALDEPTRTRIEFITGEATPFLAHLEAWIPHAGLKPRPLDQAISSVRAFHKAVNQPLERLEAKHVQTWIDALINPTGETGTSAKTVKRKLGEVRNYWRYLQSHQIVAEDRDPFARRRIKDPANRRTTRDEERTAWSKTEVVMLWTTAEARKDVSLAQAIRLAAYTGARIEGVAQLRVSDIRTDTETQIRFMRMADKTQAGDRDVPIHPEIEPLINRLVKDADTAGYLVHTTAKNKYGERSQPMGKRFGRMKTALGYDRRHVFHSIRYTVAGMFQDAGCAEGVAADIVGHLKPGLTFGLYGGTTAMKLRYAELVRCIAYPTMENGESSTAVTT